MEYILYHSEKIDPLAWPALSLADLPVLLTTELRTKNVQVSKGLFGQSNGVKAPSSTQISL